MHSTSLRRNDLDLLRAIAVTIVVLYHAGFNSFEYGYIGVDIFFVLSGFLIGNSSSKIADLTKFTSFLKRRFYRIIPSSVLVLFFALIFSQILFFPNDIKNVSTSVIASYIQQANLLFFLKSNYFSFNNIYEPLIHYWSLGVEWAFYILMASIYLLSRRPLLILSYIFFGSIIIYIIGEELFPNFTFYMFPGRLWEFLLPVVFLPRVEKHISHLNENYLSFVWCLSLLVLILTLFLPNDFINESFRTYLIVFACFSIIALNRNPINRNKFYVVANFIAKISFSWYLVHQVLFAFANYQFDLMNTYAIKVIAVILSFLLAIILYFFWERQFFEDKLKAGLVRKSLFVIILIIVPTLSILNYMSIDFRSKLTNDDLAYAENLSIQQIPFGECHFSHPTALPKYELITNCVEKTNGPIYIVFGDSHAEDIYRSLRYSLDNMTIVNFASGGCRLSSNQGCASIEFEKFIKEMQPLPMMVIYHQSGMYLLKTDNVIANRQLLYKGNSNLSVNQDEVARLIDMLSKFMLEKVYFLGPWVDPFINPRLILGNFEQCRNYNIEIPHADEYTSLDNYLELQTENNSKIEYLSAIEIFWESESSYLMSCSHGVHWRDMDHLSWAGMRFFSGSLKDAIGKF